MFLFFSNAPSWFMFSLWLIPFAVFLSMRGIYILVKGKSAIAIWYVVAFIIFSFLTAAYFVILGKEIPDIFLYLSFPFGISVMFLVAAEKSIAATALGFMLGVFFNACAFASLIEFTEKLLVRRKQKLK